MTTSYCARCGGTNVQLQMWVYVNNLPPNESMPIPAGTVLDYCSEDDDSTWCDDCQDHTGLR